MKQEIEVKFCDIDIDDMRARLEKAGATLEQPMRLMRRSLIETDEMKKDNAFLRLRDESDKVTLTYKQHLNTGIHAANEIETTVASFDTTQSILEASGLRISTYQESRRETWKLGAVEVVIDEWPWMPPYVEIEGESESAVKQAAKMLRFDWGIAMFGGADVIYASLYDMDEGTRGVIDIPEVRFGAPLPKQFHTK